MKKFLSTCLAVMLLITTIPIGIFNFTAIAETEGVYTYEVYDGEAEITGVYEYISGYITVPSTLGGYPVTSISSYAFYGCDYVTSITLPYGVEYIGFYAFSCAELTDVYIPESVEYIDEAAFGYCPYLEYIEVSKYNEYYSSIGGVLFNKDKSTLLLYPMGKTASFCSIPNTVTTIADYAFEDCGYLESVTIPDSVLYIGENAFAWCYSLKTVTIPKNVEYIGDLAFYECYWLENINVSASNKYYSSVSGVLFDKNKTRLICYPLGKTATKYTIPSTVTVIGTHAFTNCEILSTITIPNSVKIIEDLAFYGCEEFYNIVLPDGITSIGSDAFAYTGYYNSHSNWTNGVLYIGKHLITADYETFLGDYYIKNNTKTIADYAFYGCESLTGITIPNSVIAIGNNAFLNCESLINVTIGTGVEVIGVSAFDACYSLEKIVIPNNVKTIGDYAFYECGELSTVTIGTGVEVIGVSAFDACYNLEKIVIPNNVKTIGDYAFYDCESLSTVTIGAKVETIGTGSFYNCYNLEKIVIPNSVRIIGDYAFNWCESLSSVTIGTSVETIGEGAFEACYNLEKIIIPDNTKTIGNSAFSNCESLVDVTLGANVETIGDYAFFNCLSLSKINIPKKVNYIEEGTFLFCYTLESIFIPEGVSYIDPTAFWGCLGLTNFSISASNNYYKKVNNVLYTADLTEVVVIPASETKVVIEPKVAELDMFHLVNEFTNLTEVYILGDQTNLVFYDEEILESDVDFAHIYCHKGSESEVDAIDFGLNHTTYSEIPLNAQSKNQPITVLASENANIGDNARINAKCCSVEDGKAVYEVSIESNGEDVEPDKPVLVAFKDIDGLNLNRCKVYKVNGGTLVEVNTKYIEGVLMFNADELGKYSIETLPFEPGDINDDGSIDLTDVVTLAQVVAEWNVECNVNALDVNGDGDVSLTDVVHLAQYVAEWQGIELH